MQTPRMYHSTAILVPDGRVIKAGGGQGGGRIHDYTTMEIFSPPYLFKGERPVISSAPRLIGYGQTVSVETPEQKKPMLWPTLSVIVDRSTDATAMTIATIATTVAHRAERPLPGSPWPLSKEDDSPKAADPAIRNRTGR